MEGIIFMETESVAEDKTEKKKIYHITVRFDKQEYKKLSEAFWKSGKYMGVIAREATMEYLRTHFPDDEIKT